MATNIVEILIKATDDFSAVTKQAKKEISSLGEMSKVVLGLSAAFTAAAGTIFALTKALADYGDEINTAKQKTGIAAEQLSVLKYAAEQSETSFDALVTGLTKFSQASVKALSGNKEQAETFHKLGITLTDVTGKVKPLNQLFLEFADRM